ncbi:polyprotein [Cluster bean endornavirus 1]|uniref:Polyprotein n=1 Tax=Cluster bean endornavirus 1 TaxID=2340808 RepID=A0A385MIV5_9VIRU|nr:polyprotein [Cluster bean endornavirus 1]AYA60157.1 polyprotein [Cluster bean endornavirus 1]
MVVCCTPIQFVFDDPLLSSALQPDFIATWWLAKEQGMQNYGLTPEQFKPFVDTAGLSVEDPANNLTHKYYYEHKKDGVECVSVDEGGQLGLMESALNKIIAKYGGLKGMQHKCMLASWTKVPVLAKLNNKIVPFCVDNETIGHRLCCNCHTMNLYWMPGENGLDDAWCGCCGADLNYMMVTEAPTPGEKSNDTGEHINNGMGADQLEQLQQLKYLDGAELDGKVREKAIEHDARIMRSMISRTTGTVIKLEPGMTESQTGVLKSTFNQYVIVVGQGPPNPHAMLANERRCIFRLLLDLSGTNRPHVDIGGARLGPTTDQYRCMAPIMGWRDVERASAKVVQGDDCCHRLANCYCDVDKQPSLISVDSLYDIDPLELKEYMLRSGSDTIFYCLSTASVPEDANNGDFLFEQGKWSVHESKLISCYHGENLPYVNDYRTSMMWTHSDVIVMGEYSFGCSTIETVGNHVIRMARLTRNGPKSLGYTKRVVEYDVVKSIDVPVINSESLKNILSPSLLTKRTIKVDARLLKMLIVRDLTNSCTYEDMVTYAIGIAHSKYQLASRMISNNYITADMALDHALLATIISRRATSYTNRLIRQTQLVNQPMHTIRTSSWSDLWQILFGCFVDQAIMGIDEAQNRVHGQVMSKVMHLIEEWMHSVNWDDLLNFSLQFGWKDLKVVTCKESYSEPDSVQTCTHHSQNCLHDEINGNKLCACCLLIRVAMGESKCECCKPSRCTHACSHLCDGLDTHHTSKGGKTKVCECCKVEHFGSKCGVCQEFVHEKTVNIPVIIEHSTRDQPRKEWSEKRYVKAKLVPDAVKLLPGKTDKQEVTPLVDINKMIEQTMQERNATPMPSSKATVEMLAALTSAVHANLFSEDNPWVLTEPGDSHITGFPGWSEIKFVGMGMTVMDKSDFEVVEVTKASGEGLLCGRNCLQILLGTVDNDALQRLSGVKNNYSNLDLMNYLTMLNKNCCILMENSAVVNRVDVGSDEFACIVHSSWFGNEIGHWDVCNIRHKSCLSYVPLFYPWMTSQDVLTAIDVNVYGGTDIHNLDAQSRLEIACMIYESYVGANSKYGLKISAPRVDKVGNEYLITNNNKNLHEPGKYLFTFKVPEEYVALITESLKPTMSIKASKLFRDAFDRKRPTNALEMKSLMDDWLKQRLRNISSSLLSMQGEEGVDRQENEVLVKVYRHNGVNYVDRIGQLAKLKTSDVCLITSGNVKEWCVMEMAGNKLIMHCNRVFKSGAKIHLVVPKISVCSEIMGLMALFSGQLQWEKLISLLKNGSCVLGPAGSGKTERLLQMAGSKVTILTKTFSAREEIKSRLQVKTPVLSMEKATIKKVDSEIVLIDEATMVSIEELALAITDRVQKLYLFGDEFQVGMIDTDQHHGVREVFSVASMVDNVERLEVTYRFGEDVCKVLRNLGQKVTSASKHNTIIELVDMPDIDIERLNSIRKRVNPDVVLCFYTRTKQILEGRMGATPVFKVHEFQSKSANAVMVVQHNPASKSGGIWQDPKYCISAVTRCKTKLIWVSVDMPPGKPLHVRCGGMGPVGNTGGLQQVLSTMFRRSSASLSRHNGDEPFVVESAKQHGAEGRRSWAEMVEEDDQGADIHQLLQGGGDHVDLISGAFSYDAQMANYNERPFIITSQSNVMKLIKRYLDEGTSTYKCGGVKIWSNCKSHPISISAVLIRGDTVVVLSDEAKAIINKVIDELGVPRTMKAFQSHGNKNTFKEHVSKTIALAASQRKQERTLIKLITDEIVNCEESIKLKKVQLPVGWNISSMESRIQRELPPGLTTKTNGNEIIVRGMFGIKQWTLRVEDGELKWSDADIAMMLWKYRPELIMELMMYRLASSIDHIANSIMTAEDLNQAEKSVDLLQEHPTFERALVLHDDDPRKLQIALTMDAIHQGCLLPGSINVTDWLIPVREEFDDAYFDVHVTDRMEETVISIIRPGCNLATIYTNFLRNAVYVAGGLIKQKLIASFKCRTLQLWEDVIKQNQFDVVFNEDLMSGLEYLKWKERTVDMAMPTLNQTLMQDDHSVLKLPKSINLTNESRPYDFNKQHTEKPRAPIDITTDNCLCGSKLGIKISDVDLNVWKLSQCSGLALMRIPKVALLVQHVRIGGGVFEWNTPYGMVALTTFGGCALCCGVIVEFNGEVVLVMDRLQCTKPRHYVIRKEFLEVDSMLADCLLHRFSLIEPNCVNFQATNIRQMSHAMLYLPDPVDSLTLVSMVTERLNAIGRYTYKRFRHLEWRHTAGVFKKDNEVTIHLLQSKLGDEYKLVDNVKIDRCMRLWPSPVRFQHRSGALVNVCYTGSEWWTDDLVLANKFGITPMSYTELIDRSFDERLKSHGYNHLLEFNSRKQPMGANEILNYSLDYHKANKTKVSAILSEKMEAALSAQLKTLGKTIFVSEKQYAEYGALLKADLPNCSVSTHGTWVASGGFDQLVEMVGIKYSYMKFPDGEPILYLGDHPENVLISSSWAMHTDFLTSHNNVYHLGISSCNQIMDKLWHIYSKAAERASQDPTYEMSSTDLKVWHNAQKYKQTGSCQWVNSSLERTKVKARVLWMGMSWMTLSTQQIGEEIKRRGASTCCLLLPSQDHSGMYPFNINKFGNSWMAAYKGNNWPIDINQDTWNVISTKPIYRFGDARMVVHHEGMVLGHVKVRLTVLPDQLRGPDYQCRMQSLMANQKVVFSIPNIGAKRELGRKQQTRLIEVDQNFYRYLSLKVKLPGCKFSDLLPYARTYIQTTLYTHLGVNDRLNNLVSYCHEVCACVYLEHIGKTNDVYETMRQMEKFWGLQSADYKEWSKAYLWSKISEFASLIDPVGILSQLFNTNKIREAEELFFEALKEIRQFSAHRVYPEFKITKITCEPGHSDGDGANDPPQGDDGPPADDSKSRRQFGDAGAKASEFTEYYNTIMEVTKMITDYFGNTSSTVDDVGENIASDDNYQPVAGSNESLLSANDDVNETVLDNELELPIAESIREEEELQLPQHDDSEGVLRKIDAHTIKHSVFVSPSDSYDKPIDEVNQAGLLTGDAAKSIENLNMTIHTQQAFTEDKQLTQSEQNSASVIVSLIDECLGAASTIVPLRYGDGMLQLDDTYEVPTDKIQYKKYYAYDAKHVTEFNPSAQGDCVMLCLEHWAGANNKQIRGTSVVPTRNWLNEDQVVMIALFNNVNVSITYKRKTVLHKFSDKWDTVNIHHVVLRNRLHHCELIKFLNVNYEQATSGQYRLTGKNVNDIVNLLKSCGDANDLPVDKVMNHLSCIATGTLRSMDWFINHINEADGWGGLTSILELSNQLTAAKRKQVPMLTCDVQVGENVVALRMDDRTIAVGDCLALSNGTSWYMSCVLCHQRNWLICSNPAPAERNWLPVCVHMQYKWLSQRTQNRVIVHPGIDLNKCTCLNNDTKRMVAQWSTCPPNMSVGRTGAENLLIGHYDNISHHKYDDRHILEKYDPSQWVGVGFGFDSNLVSALLDRSTYYRTCIVGGSVRVAIKFEEVRLGSIVKHWVTSMMAECVRVGNEIRMSKTEWLRVKPKVCVAIEKCMQVDGQIVTCKKIKDCDFHCSNMEEFSSVVGMEVTDNSMKLLEQLFPATVQWRSVKSVIDVPDVNRHITNSVVRLGHNRFYLSDSLSTITIMKTMKGGSWVDVTETTTYNEDDRWWGTATGVVDKESQVRAILGNLVVEPLSDAEVHTLTHPVQCGTDVERALISWADEIDWDSSYVPGNVYTGVTPSEVIDLWTVHDMSGYITKYAPTSEMSIVCKTVVAKLMTTTKVTLSQYPEHARPVFTKKENQEFNAISGRLGKEVVYRTEKLDPIQEANHIANTFFRPDWKQLSLGFRANQVTYSTEDTIQWLKTRPDACKITQELMQILQEGLVTHPMNKMKVHLKLESLLKDEPVTDHRQTKARILVWQMKGLCAIFSPVFKEAKQRLKSVLGVKTLYADGLRPDQLASRVAQVPTTSYLIENDMQQQDRQTDETLLNIEMQLYLILGVDQALVGLWRSCHDNWYFRGKSCSGYKHAMRLTGQATTALGNAITNLAVHWRICQSLGRDWKWFCVLGDDGILMSDRKLDAEDLKTYGKKYCNMILKPKVSKNSATFCCFTIYRTRRGNFALGPDPIRLKRRFEVTNGVSQMTKQNVEARTMSYCMMLGDIKETSNVINKLSLPIKPVKWYDVQECFKASDEKHGEYMGCSEDCVSQLCNMMINPVLYEYTMTHWSESQ